MVGNAFHHMKSKILLINLFAIVLDREHISLTFIYTCIEFSAYVAHIIHADMSVISCIIRAICLIVTSYDNNK